MVKVLFVCMGNICRSPTAEGVFAALVEREGLSAYISIDSAGTFTLCDSRGAAAALAINVNAMGRVSKAKDTDSDNIVNNNGGSNVTCPS